MTALIEDTNKDKSFGAPTNLNNENSLVSCLTLFLSIIFSEMRQ